MGISRQLRRLLPVIVEQAGNGHVIPGRRAPSAGPLAAGRRHGHGEHVWQALRCRDGGDGHGAVVLRRLAVDGRDVLEMRRLEGRVVHQAAIWGRVWRRRADTSGAVAPDLLELGW
jgi:hypothetical protein